MAKFNGSQERIPANAVFEETIKLALNEARTQNEGLSMIDESSASNTAPLTLDRNTTLQNINLPQRMEPLLHNITASPNPLQAPNRLKTCRSEVAAPSLTYKNPLKYTLRDIGNALRWGKRVNAMQDISP